MPTEPPPTPLPAVPTTPRPARPTPRRAPWRSGHRARRPVVLLACLLALVGLLGTGCVRVRAGMAVSPEDRVSGTIDIATPDGAPGGSGPPLQIPSGLSGDVTLERYEQDGYVGTHVVFKDLTFDDLSRTLPSISATTTSAIRLNLRRAGDRVILSGKVDLTRITAESADVQLKMAFPGAITQTDGTNAQGVISWTFQPGSVGDVNAVAEYPDPSAPSWVSWALLLFALVAVAVAVVVGLAAAARPHARSRARR